MMETDTPIYINNIQIEHVENYIYLGQRYNTRDQKQDKEIQIRFMAGGHGQDSPSTVTTSWTHHAHWRDVSPGHVASNRYRKVTLEHDEKTSLRTTHVYFQQ